MYLHLAFARRLRLAEGLHPLAAEALARRPAMVAFGAALCDLPGNERKGMSWLRRLFSSGGEAARWQERLASVPGQPRVDLVVNLLNAQDWAGEPPALRLGGMARVAIGLGFLAHELLEETVGPLTIGLGPERAAVERAQARLWIQSAISRNVSAEWRPLLDLAEIDAARRGISHVDRAIARVYGTGPGDAALARWLRGIAVDLQALADPAHRGGGLPPPLALLDHAARATHFDQAAFVEKTQRAVGWFVYLSGQVADVIARGGDNDTLVNAIVVPGGKALAEGPSAADAARARWRTWFEAARTASFERGRNPKPAFEISGELRLPVVETPVSGQGVHLPEAHGAAGAPPPPPLTQELSLSQIEAEMRAPSGFPSPAHTQEISVAQIEAMSAVSGPVPAAPAGFASPAFTQEVAPNQIEGTQPRAPAVTQQISVDDVLAELPKAPAVTQQISADDVLAALPRAQNHITQPISADDVVAAAPKPPNVTQQISAEDVVAALAAVPALPGTAPPVAPAPVDTSAPAPAAPAAPPEPPRE